MSMSNISQYICKFDADGKIAVSLPYITGDVKDGYVKITADEWAYYVGNRGAGDNGTGYVRDPGTGKPVSAPPAPPAEATETPVANVPETEIAVMEGMVDMQNRIAALEEEIARLKGGNGQ